MANVQWTIKGPSINTCNCAWGCPCQFNALPTQGHCRATVAMRIEEGHFGEVRLDGVKWVSLLAWPGPIHHGKGEVQTIVDEGADDRQRAALMTILKGDETEPGATIFNVLAAMLDTVHKPLFLPIEFEVDIAARIARFAVPDMVEARIEPIRNPVTGAPHRAKVILPDGFEYHEAEYASSTTKASGPVPQDWADRHAHLFMTHMTRQGVVHA
jgi:hypothetical protein